MRKGPFFMPVISHSRHRLSLYFGRNQRHLHKEADKDLSQICLNFYNDRYVSYRTHSLVPKIFS